MKTGGYQDIEPVAVIPLSDTAGLRVAFREMFLRGNPVIPTFVGRDVPPVVLKFAGLKSFTAFARGTLVWVIDGRDGVWKIVPQKKGPERGWQYDFDRIMPQPPGTSIDELSERVVAVLQAAANEAVAHKD